MPEPAENRIPKEQKPVNKKHEIPELSIEIKSKRKKPPEQKYSLN